MQSLAQENTESGWPSGSAMNVGFIINKTLKESTNILNEKYEELFVLINGYNKNDTRLEGDVRKQREAWLAYYPTECNISGTLSRAGGSWPSTYSVQCYVMVVAEQTKKISSIIDCLKKADADDKISDEEKDNGIFTVAGRKDACLYKLGSMVLHYDSSIGN